MKNYFAIFVLGAGLLFAGFFHFKGVPVEPDLAPQFVTNTNIGEHTDTIPLSTFPFTTVFNYNYAGIGALNSGSVGAMWLNGKYYFNKWNSTRLYIVSDNGPGGGPGSQIDSIVYLGSFRDLTTDGTFLYGGQANNFLYRIDPNTGWTLKTFNLAGGSSRALAWDPNRKGFWNSAFAGDIFFHDTNGVLKMTIPSTLTGKYGMAFDSTSSVDSAFLWIWNQGTGSLTNELVKYHINSGNIKAVYIINLVAQSVGVAGGAEMVIKNNKLMLLLNYQGFALVGYKIKDIPVTNINNSGVKQVSFTLEQNYPNPFNPVTKIIFKVKLQSGEKKAPVRIKIFDISGREINTIVNDIFEAGEHEVTIDGRGLSSGIYFYRMTSGEFSDTKQMILIK